MNAEDKAKNKAQYKLLVATFDRISDKFTVDELCELTEKMRVDGRLDAAMKYEIRFQSAVFGDAVVTDEKFTAALKSYEELWK